MSPDDRLLMGSFNDASSGTEPSLWKGDWDRVVVDLVKITPLLVPFRSVGLFSRVFGIRRICLRTRIWEDEEFGNGTGGGRFGMPFSLFVMLEKLEKGLCLVVVVDVLLEE